MMPDWFHLSSTTVPQTPQVHSKRSPLLPNCHADREGPVLGMSRIRSFTQRAIQRRPQDWSPVHEVGAALLLSLVMLRTILLVWAAIIFIAEIRAATPLNISLGWSLLASALATTVILSWLIRNHPGQLKNPLVAIIDTVVAALVAMGDPWVFSTPHAQSFGSAWPIGAAVATGILHGPGWGAVSGATIGIAGAISGVASGHDWAMSGLSMTSTTVLLMISGAVAGYVTRAIQQAELSASRAAAREELARKLHDGVLQTLAVIQRRSNDHDLVQMAREQEQDLRTYIAQGAQPLDVHESLLGVDVDYDPATIVDVSTLTQALRKTVSSAEQRYGLRTNYVEIDLPTVLPLGHINALCGVVAESITNAHKHGAASLVTVCVDLEVDLEDESSDVQKRSLLTCSVVDNGSGIDPADLVPGQGLTSSVFGRISEVGGTVALHPKAGHGVEVIATIPL